MLDRLIQGLAVVTSGCAVWFALFWILRGPDDLTLKLAVMALILVQGVLTFLTLGSTARASALRPVLLASAFVLAAVGAYAVWFEARPEVADFEGSILLAGFLVLAQSVLTLVRFARPVRSRVGHDAA